MLDINVASIKTTVSFVVDKQSIAAAKKSTDDLKKHFEKIADPKIRFQNQKQRMQKARQQADDARFNTSPKNSAEMKAQRAAEKQKARDEKARLREQAQLQKRQETAELKLRHAGLQLGGIKGKYGLDPKQQYEALRYIRQQTEAFAQGQISSARMNASIRERITLERRAAAAAQKAAQAQRTNYVGAAKKLKDPQSREYGIAGMQGAALGLGSMFAGANLVNRIKTTGDDNLDLIRKSKAVAVNPNAIRTIVTANRQRGIDSNYDTITDNFKDVRERLGESVTNTTFDQKSGKWKGGNGAIDNILNQFGWNKQQIAQYQDNPLDFVQAVQNEGQRRGMSDASIGHLLEDLGNDMSYLVPILKNNGAEYSKTLKQLVDSGQTLNDEQIRQTLAYGDLSVAMGNLMNGVDNSMFTGFMKGFADGGDDLVNNTKVITEAAGSLGEGLGNLSKEITGFVGEISSVVSDINAGLKERFPQWFTDSDKPAAQAVYDGVTGSANGVAGWIQDQTGWNPQTVAPAIKSWLGIDDQQAGTAANQYNLNGQALRDNTISSLASNANAPSFNLAPVFNLQVNPQVGLTLQSDVSRLSDYIDFNAKASADSFTRSLTLSALSGQSSTGG